MRSAFITGGKNENPPNNPGRSYLPSPPPPMDWITYRTLMTYDFFQREHVHVIGSPTARAASPGASALRVCKDRSPPVETWIFGSRTPPSRPPRPSPPADNRLRATLRRLGKETRDFQGAVREIGHLENPHRAVPDDGLGAPDFHVDRLSPSRTDIQPPPAGGILETGTTFRWALFSILSAMTQSTGSMNRLWRARICSRRSFAISSFSSSTIESPISSPCARRNVNAIPPPMTSASIFGRRF